MQQQFEGLVENVVFSNPDTGFTVAMLRLEETEELIKIVGEFPQLYPGTMMTVTGKFEPYKEEEQFRVQSYVEGSPVTVEGIQKYLGSGRIKGIGPVIAERIVAEYGDKTLEVLENHIDWLIQIPGIGEAKLTKIKESWTLEKDVKGVIIFLQSNGVSAGFALKIYKKWGKNAINKVKANPYCLTEISGIGFIGADGIARRLGVADDSPHRIQAAIVYSLQQAATSAGHCFLPDKALTRIAQRHLAVPSLNIRVQEKAVRQQITEMTATEQLFIAPSRKRIGEFACYLPMHHHAEVGLAKNIARLLQTPLPVNMVQVEQQMLHFIRRTGKPLSEEQQQAIKTAATQRFACLVGAPGCGKTHSAEAVIDLWESQGKIVRLAAPTGRAARRLAELTHRPATTIHRLLDYSGGQFGYDAKHPLPVDAILIDEVSMLDIFLANSLFRAIDPHRTQIVFVGDRFQLTSVAAGAVLRDLIRSEVVPTTELTKIFRQAQQSAIVRHAHAIKDGIMPSFHQLKRTDVQLPRHCDCILVPTDAIEDGVAVVQELLQVRLPSWGFPEDQVQILSPTRTKTLVATRQFNPLIQSLVNPKHPDKTESSYEDAVIYREGDRVIQLTNNYDENVFNGELGLIDELDTEELIAKICFKDETGNDRVIAYEKVDWDQFAHSYAITGHKAQGSQFPVVIIPLFTATSHIVSRNWLYTALTRAQKLAVIVGQTDAIKQAIKRQTEAHTLLARRLRDATRSPPAIAI